MRSIYDHIQAEIDALIRNVGKGSNSDLGDNAPAHGEPMGAAGDLAAGYTNDEPRW